MTFRHIGILLIIIGTFFLAFAVRIENKYTLSARNKRDKKYWEDIVKRAQDGSFYEPTIVFINKFLFYLGLVCIAVGSLLQW
jgi:hypothetical protein